MVTCHLPGLSSLQWNEFVLHITKFEVFARFDIRVVLANFCDGFESDCHENNKSANKMHVIQGKHALKQ